MRASFIFFKKGYTKFQFIPYDCCENLGSDFNTHSFPVMYISIPIKEMDEFFLNQDNLITYLKLISDTFDIKYEIANDDVNLLDESKWKAKIEEVGEMILIKVTSKEKCSNKYFNVPFNYVRYLWYQHYTNIAIIATNLAKLDLLQNNIDILAIASSFQNEKERAVLPTKTIEIEGLLYFRESSEIKSELARCSSFNGVFYKYCVYFDPIVKIKGSFFNTAESIIPAKTTIAKLSTMGAIEDIPNYFIKALKTIIQDYMVMKQTFTKLSDFLKNKNYSISSSSPILLSTDKSVIEIKAINSMGNGTNLKYELYPEEKSSEKELETIELPF